MSEYWKSTPKYWCKFCKTYVRDTPLEKKQHEATGRHQGAIQKSLRELHKNQGREEREKDKAKAELARLNGIVSGGPAASGPSSTPIGAVPTISVAKSKPHFTPNAVASRVTADERRRQAEQLAAMGVTVPDEFRKDMSIASEWSTVSVTPVYSQPTGVKKEEESDEDSKNGLVSGSGARRKRKVDDEDEEFGAESTKGGKARQVWGTTLKVYPGASGGGMNTDFDSLLSSTATKVEPSANTSTEPDVTSEDAIKVKKEDVDADSGQTATTTSAIVASDQVEAPVVFKKRKGKR